MRQKCEPMRQNVRKRPFFMRIDEIKHELVRISKFLNKYIDTKTSIISPTSVSPNTVSPLTTPTHRPYRYLVGCGQRLR